MFIEDSDFPSRNVGCINSIQIVDVNKVHVRSSGKNKSLRNYAYRLNVLSQNLELNLVFFLIIQNWKLDMINKMDFL